MISKETMIKDISKELSEIYKIVLEINAKGKCIVFFEDAGHVQKIDIRIHLGKYKIYSDADMSEEIKYDLDDNYFNFKRCIKKLKNLKDTLHKINKNGRINFEDYRYEEETIRKYKLERC